MLKQLVTTKYLCEALNVTPMTIYNWRKQGLPVVKFGRTVRFDEKEVLDWLKEKRD